MKKIIFSLLILIISYNGYSQNNVFSKNVFNNDTLVSRFMSLKKQTSYPSNPRTNTIINYKDTLKYYDGVQWKSVNNTGIPYTGAYKSIDFNGKVIKNFFISKTADTTAKVVFDVSSIPTNTIRTINVPNRSFRLDSLTTTTSTAINGLLKGNGANLAAATGNTDYQLPYFLKTGSSITPITSTNYLTFNKDNTGTTVGQAIELFNNQAATIGSQSQYSPVIRWKASRWDTDDAIARTSFMEMGDIYSAGTTAPFAGLLVRGSTDGVTYADFFRITHRLSDNTADYNLTGALTTSSSATATNYAVSSTSTNSYTASKLNIGTVRRLAFYSPNDQAATVGTPVQNPGRITLSGAVYNSVTQGHVWDIHLSGVANTKYSSILFSHSTDGTTSVRNFLNLKAGLSVTGNSFLMSDGASDLSPNLSVTSAGKSTAIGGNASNSYIVADNSAAFIIGGDSKSNIDAGTPSPTAWLTMSNTQFSISKLSNRRIPFNTTSEGLKDTIDFTFTGGYLDVPGLKIAGSILTPIALRTFGDVGTGAVTYNGTTKANGQFYGGTTDPDGSTRGNYDGHWYASKLYSSNQVYAGTSLTENTTIGTTTVTMTSGGNTMLNFTPTTDAATTPYTLKTSINHTSGKLLDLFNLNSSKFSVDYKGMIAASDGMALNYWNIGNSTGGTAIIAGTQNYTPNLIGNAPSFNKPAYNFYNSSTVVGLGHGSLGLFLTSDNKFRFNKYGTTNDTLFAFYTGNINNDLQSGRLKYWRDTSGLAYENRPHIALYRNTDLTISASLNVWNNLTGFTSIDGDYMTLTGDSIQITKAGHFLITWTSSFSGLNNEVWELAVFKNNILQEPSQLRYTSTSDVGNMSCPVYVNSDGNDWFTFKIRNTTDNDDPTIKRTSIIISTIHLNL